MGEDKDLMFAGGTEEFDERTGKYETPKMIDVTSPWQRGEALAFYGMSRLWFVCFPRWMFRKSTRTEFINGYNNGLRLRYETLSGFREPFEE